MRKQGELELPGLAEALEVYRRVAALGGVSRRHGGRPGVRERPAAGAQATPAAGVGTAVLAQMAPAGGVALTAPGRAVAARSPAAAGGATTR